MYLLMRKPSTSGDYGSGNKIVVECPDMVSVAAYLKDNQWASKFELWEAKKLSFEIKIDVKED